MIDSRWLRGLDAEVRKSGIVAVRVRTVPGKADVDGVAQAHVALLYPVAEGFERGKEILCRWLDIADLQWRRGGHLEGLPFFVKRNRASQHLRHESGRSPEKAILEGYGRFHLAELHLHHAPGISCGGKPDPLAVLGDNTPVEQHRRTPAAHGVHQCGDIEQGSL